MRANCSSSRGHEAAREVLAAQQCFYDALTSKDVGATERLWAGAEEDASVSEAISQGARVEPWAVGSPSFPPMPRLNLGAARQPQTGAAQAAHLQPQHGSARASAARRLGAVALVLIGVSAARRKPGLPWIGGPHLMFKLRHVGPVGFLFGLKYSVTNWGLALVPIGLP